MKKMMNEFHALVWTLAGTGLVLITLSGDTKTMGLWITGVAIVVHLVGLIGKE
jgi:hypothetical protein